MEMLLKSVQEKIQIKVKNSKAKSTNLEQQHTNLSIAILLF